MKIKEILEMLMVTHFKLKTPSAVYYITPLLFLSYYLFFCFLVVLGFELSILHLLSKSSTA
jgi:hypothetical protein